MQNFSGFKNAINFYVRQLEIPKNVFQKCDAITFTCFLLAIAQPKTKILLWNFVCVLFVWILITYFPFFLKISPGFENISRNQKFWSKNLKILRFFWFWKFRNRSFLCQAFLCLWPDFGVSRLLIGFSAIFFH